MSNEDTYDIKHDISAIIFKGLDYGWDVVSMAEDIKELFKDREFISWFDSNTDKPDIGQLVLTRNRQLSYGGDLYSYELMRMDSSQRWYHQDYRLIEAPPDEWSALVVKVP